MPDPETTRFSRITITPSDEPRTITVYHDGDHEVWIDGVMVYAPPTNPREDRI